MKTITLEIDGKSIETGVGRTILEAALENGMYIPHLCYHPDLRPAGACRLCLVEVDGMEGTPTSCTTPAAEGMVVRTRSERLDAMRRLAMELILADHPEECLACSQYLRCELQSVKQYLGLSEDLRVKRRRKPIPENRLNPLFVHDFTRCVFCGRCVRACNELRGTGVLQFIGKGEAFRVGIPDGRTLAEAGCRFCGACVEVCPTGALRDKEELMEGRKRREALVPCTYTCPARIDVPRYLRLIGENRIGEAVAVIREKVPFPRVLGYVCGRPCEGACRRGAVNEAIAIRDLKRFAAEGDRERLWERQARMEPPTDHRVAVVGSGPAGLTAAYYLAKLGHGVTVLEALPVPGGMMRYGIPEYRLPRAILDEEIREIEKAGVEIRTNTRVASLDDLMLDEDYDAVIVAPGAHGGQRLPIPGADLGGVDVGLDVLRDANLGKPVRMEGRVLVLGGGNVALDCGRMALRLGAEEVHLACLEKKGAMPAAREEIEQGEKEGLVVHPSRTFKRIVARDGRVAGVECLEVASFSFDEEGDLHLDVVEGSEHVLEANRVIFAVGQHPEIPEGFELDLDERGRIDRDPYTLETNLEGVFAAGDAVTGTAYVIDAVASGRSAAEAVDRCLGGEGDIEERLAPREEVPATWLGPGEGFARLGRCGAVSDETAAPEAARCLRCDGRLRITPVKFWGEY